MMPRPRSDAADRCRVCGIVGTDIADTGTEFQIPPLAEQPLVSIAYSGTVIPSFVSFVTAVSEQAERCTYIAGIELTAMDMQSEKMSVEFFTEPVAGFRLNEKMLPFPVFTEIPSVIVS